MLKKLIASVEEVERLALVVAALTACPKPPRPEVLADARWQFTRQSMLHIQLKERLIYANLESSNDPRIAETVRGFRESQEALHLSFHAHMQHWTGEAAQKDWRGFGLAVASMQKFLFDRIALERKVLYPLAQRSLNASAADCAPIRNWNKDIWAIKDAIEKQ